MKKQKDLSVIIVNWNNSELLKNCLNSIYKHCRNFDFDVFVVDNNSSDDSVKVAKSFKKVKLIVNKDNLGFAKANNQAIMKTNARYLLLLNNDTLVVDNSFKRMIDFMDKNENIAVLGCKMYCEDEMLKLQETAYRRLPTPISLFLSDFFYDSFNFLIPNNKIVRKIFALGISDYEKPQEVTHVNGACMLVRKSAIDTVGLLDENYFMYLEETDWCIRFKKAGYKIFYVPFARIVHYGWKSSSLRKDRARIYHNSQKYFLKKHYGNLSVALYQLLRPPIIILRKLNELRKLK